MNNQLDMDTTIKEVACGLQQSVHALINAAPTAVFAQYFPQIPSTSFLPAFKDLYKDILSDIETHPTPAHRMSELLEKMTNMSGQDFWKDGVHKIEEDLKRQQDQVFTLSYIRPNRIPDVFKEYTDLLELVWRHSTRSEIRSHNVRDLLVQKISLFSPLRYNTEFQAFNPVIDSFLKRFQDVPSDESKSVLSVRGILEVQQQLVQFVTEQLLIKKNHQSLLWDYASEKHAVQPALSFQEKILLSRMKTHSFFYADSFNEEQKSNHFVNHLLSKSSINEFVKEVGFVAKTNSPPAPTDDSQEKIKQSFYMRKFTKLKI